VAAISFGVRTTVAIVDHLVAIRLTRRRFCPPAVGGQWTAAADANAALPVLGLGGAAAAAVG
jgi:hypothetical protein